MSITTSPQNRNGHKIPTQITVTKITQMTVPCPQPLNLKELSMLSGSLMLRVWIRKCGSHGITKGGQPKQPLFKLIWY